MTALTLILARKLGKRGLVVGEEPEAPPVIPSGDDLRTDENGNFRVDESGNSRVWI